MAAAFGPWALLPSALLRRGCRQCYLTTPEVKPGLRRGGLISFFKKQ
jgi:hypothetical protein